jgi:hypothetical protein
MEPEDNNMVHIITQELKESREINIPFEWLLGLDLGMSGYVQITLAGDRIAIHKPTSPNVEYKSPRKVSDDSYIRSLRLFSVCIPKQLLDPLGIVGGDKITLALEENCVSIHKHTEPESQPAEPEQREPIMAFCCVCGSFRYTGNGLIKVLTKYICSDCVEIVKEL